ncbi:MAG: hypothetical protein H6739_36985 [Alphaproteobacteria bacterium]|nr:hypothetical protein [Alphaproteobacteria bacterium]
MLTVSIPSAAAWREVLQQLEQHGAAQVPRDGQEVRALTVTAIGFQARGERFARAEARVIHVSEDHVALSFEPAAARRLALVGFPEPEPDEVDEADIPEESSGDAPLWHRYEQMDKLEKVRLARTGSADARRMIFKDKDRTLHQYILNNPGLKPQELASLIRTGAPNQDFIKRVLQRQDLIGSPQVAEALIRSPHTPVTVAVELVPRLSPSTLRRIARQGNLRPEVVSAARRRVVRK